MSEPASEPGPARRRIAGPMAESFTRRILREHLAEGELSAGSPIALRVDQVLLQDATGTMAFMQFEQLGVPRVRVDRAVQYVDHNVVALDFKNPDDHRFLRALCRRHGMHFSRAGNGISHYVHLERFGRPGDVLVGADSHTTTGGALGMLSIGAGGLDVAVVMGGHPFELACPAVVEVWLEGELSRPWVQAKDVILELLRRLSATGGKDKVFEFTGPGVATLSVPERATIANMIAELGATSALFPPDERTRDWLARQHREDDFRDGGPDDGAAYDERVEIDVAALGPLVAKPHNPDNVVGVEELAGLEVAQVCMGSSVNSAYADLALPAAILADRGGQLVHPDIDATATPGSRQIQAAIIEAGVYTQLLAGGVRMLEPVCGPCVGMWAGAAVGRQLVAHVQPQLPRAVGHAVGPRVPVLTGGRGRVAADRPDRRPARVRRAARAAADARAAALPRRPTHHRARPGRRGRRDRGAARPQHQAAARAHPAAAAAVWADRHRAGRRRLHRRSGPRRRRGHVVSLQRAGDRRVHLPPSRPGIRERIREWGGGFIVGGRNYGQGSSREHAALAPLQLGVRAVIAKSFARIHRRNLVAQGILALTFSDDDAYARAQVGQCWCLPRVRDELAAGAETLTVVVEDTGEELALRHDFAPKEREILLCGGMLEYLRRAADGGAPPSVAGFRPLSGRDRG